VGAVAASIVGARWSVWALITFTLVVSGVSLLVRYTFRRIKKPSYVGGNGFFMRCKLSLVAAAVAGFVVPAAILCVRFATMFGRPENISQTYDNVFHLNAVRYIIDTGNGSSLTIGSIEPGAPGSFYPAAWHDLVALVVEAAHVSIPVGVNSVNIVVAALVWTMSCLYLVSRVLGSRPATFLIAGALAAGFSAFPYLLVYFGVLYPNFLAIAVLPALIALVADILRLSQEDSPGPVLGVALLAGATPGLGLAHPSVLMALAAFAIGPLGVWLYQRFISYRGHQLPLPRFIGCIVIAMVYAGFLYAAWKKLRPSASASFWPPKQTMAQAIGEAITNAPQGRPVPYVIFALTIIGLYAMLRERRHFWVVGSYAISILFFVAVSGFPKNNLRAFLTGVWYNDPFRLAAMLPIFALPIACYGALWAYSAAVSALRERYMGVHLGVMVQNSFGIIACVLVALVAQGGAVAAAQREAASSYLITATSQLLTLNEQTLLERIGTEIPMDAKIIANPGTGASLAYAFANRRVLLPAVNSVPNGDEKKLFSELAQVGRDSSVCSLVTKLNSYFVLDFGAQEVNGGHHTFPTSEQLTQAPGLKLVDHEGSVKLYEIVACK